MSLVVKRPERPKFKLNQKTKIWVGLLSLSTLQMALVCVAAHYTEKTSIKFMLMSLGALSNLAFFAITFSKGFLESLSKLSGVADQLAAGNFLSELAIQMNRVGDRLNDREKQLESSIEMANRDGMTGLLNFRFLTTQLVRSFAISTRHQRPLCFLLIDVDFFKKVNDTYGHPQGDLVLKELSKLLVKCTRSTDFVFRYGGEEFAILVHESKIQGAKTFAERIRSEFSKLEIPIEGSQNIMKCTISIGVSSVLEDNCEDLKSFISFADKKLYKAKEAGRNCVIF